MTTTIPLTRGRVTVIDSSDLGVAEGLHIWCSARGYAIASVNSKPVPLHRLLTGAKPGFVVDHINGDTLDNRRSNLRVCSQAENMRNQGKRRRNTSGFKGVTFHKRVGRWCVNIMSGYRRVHLGYFDCAEDAARAYDKAAEAIHGPFARLNFPTRNAA